MTYWNGHNRRAGGHQSRYDFRRDWHEPPVEEQLDPSFTDELYYDFYFIRRDGEIAIQWVDRNGHPTRQSPATWKHKASAKVAAELHIEKMKKARTHNGRNFSNYAFRLTDCPENNDPMRIRDDWDKEWAAAVNHFSNLVKKEG